MSLPGQSPSKTCQQARKRVLLTFRKGVHKLPGKTPMKVSAGCRFAPQCCLRGAPTPPSALCISASPGWKGRLSSSVSPCTLGWLTYSSSSTAKPPVVLWKVTVAALDSLVQVVDKDIKPNWAKHWALGSTTCEWPPDGCNYIPHHSLGPAVQAGFHSAKGAPIQAMSNQFLRDNVVGHSVKHFTKAHVNTSTAFPSPTRWVTLKWKEIKVVRKDFHKSINSGWAWYPGCPVPAFKLFCSITLTGTEVRLTDRFVVPQILFMTLLVDGHHIC